LASLDDLKAALITRAGQIEDELDRLECLMLIDEWAATKAAAQALDAGTIQTYSLMGRQVTKRDSSRVAERAAQVYADIQARLYGRGVLVADMSGRGLTGVLP
jgi:hypothetical protein